MDDEQAKRMAIWVSRVTEELGVPAPESIDVILGVAKDAAHSIERPAAPVTTFLLGYAVATGADAGDVADVIAQLARDFDG
ncbi:MAG: hypothetical protein RLZZ163_563 [Actinomycetota bacterium]|jgi:hypothetical protein